MTLKDHLRTFAVRLSGVRAKLSRSGYVSEAQAVTSDLVKALVDSSDFTAHPFETCRHLYADEPDIGGAIDRLSTLAAESLYGVKLQDFTGSETELECLRLARAIMTKLKFRSLVEQIAETLLTYGNVFLRKSDYYILPTPQVTLRPRELPLSLTETITTAEVLYLNEGTDLEQSFPYSDIYHIKYKDTPVYFTDILGRETYGLYSLSPLMRLINSTWWKRQTMIVDILLRWRMVPREHHKLKSTLFDVSRYTGSIDERREKARQDARNTIQSYINSLKSQMPDQGFVTTDNVDIDVIESRTRYTAANELLAQLDGKVWQALNLPESTVSGQTRGSFASELVSSSFVGIKVTSIIHKIEPILLDILRQRIKLVDPSLPYNRLALDFGFELEAARMERFRAASIMANLGAFTLAEIRARAGYPAEVNGELFHVPTTKPPGKKGIGDVARDVERSDSPDEPETPWSEEEHRRDLVTEEP